MKMASTTSLNQTTHISSTLTSGVGSLNRLHGKKSTVVASTTANVRHDVEELAVPDSTTPPEKERPIFFHGEDVLLKHRDGRYYLGTIVEVDFPRDQCLLRFGDNTESWSPTKALTKLSLPEEDRLCVICKKSGPKEKNEVIVCDKCGRGYHNECHQPAINLDYHSNDMIWHCKKCSENQQSQGIRRNKEILATDVNKDISKDVNKDVNKSKRKDVLRKLYPPRTESPSINLAVDRSKLPYDLDQLNWDTYHRVNMEQIYCYCGRNGEWYTQMLQCGRCRQWFHEKCVHCLQYPLYCGDRFYVFVCSTCNYGKEFLRRLEMKWVDMVHLMLFNLTAFNAKKYYDLDTIIIPYMNDNWHALQLPPKIHNVSKPERRENVLSVLTNNRNRFKCGREIKKRTTIWGLRVRLPPPAPCVTLPSIGPISEVELRERWHGNRRLQFLPLSERCDGDNTLFTSNMTEDSLNRTDMVVPVDPAMLGLMMGTAYQNSVLQSETESPCPSPEIEEKLSTASLNSLAATINSAYEGGGFVKRSVPFPAKCNVRRKKLLTVCGSRDKILMRRQKQKRKYVLRKGDSEKSVKDLRFNKVRKLIRNSLPATVGGDVTQKSDDNFPPTPPTSVSAPPTPPATNSVSQSALSEVSSDYLLSSENLAQNFTAVCDNFTIDSCRIDPTITKLNVTSDNLATPGFEAPVQNSIESNTPCDTSGDETSSKSTLDLIIPPPKDFEGKNNPFRNLPKDNTSTPLEKTAVVKSVVRVSLPLPLTPVMPLVRTLKRQLSEKDICIGPNGEVKRRRHRRTRTALLNATASKNATILPVHANGKPWTQRNLRSNVQPIANCVDYALNGRRLRQRHDKNAEAGRATNLKSSIQSVTVPSSPAKSESNISIDDLKSSVNIYFGAANRIASGEKFTVRASRVGAEGKLQYLIEWEGHNQSVT